MPGNSESFQFYDRLLTTEGTEDTGYTFYH